MYLGIRIYSRTAKNGSFVSHQYLLQSCNYFSPCGCQRADKMSFEKDEEDVVFGKNGGPDWTRTSDPRLIKAVL